MAKNIWRELLPCKECYQVVKNKHRLAEDDSLEIEVYDQDLAYSQAEDVAPYHVFKLNLRHLIRPGAQRNRQLYSLLSEKSLSRCEQIMEQNSKEYHRNIWLSSQKNTLTDEEYNKFGQDDGFEDNPKILVWKKNKKREFKSYYNNLEQKDLIYGKGCHVDFYLSLEDSRGLIAKINRGEKFRFFIHKDGGQKEYLAEKTDISERNGKTQDVYIRTFVVKIYSSGKLILKLMGGVYFAEVDKHLSLDSLYEYGIEPPSMALGGCHV
ncbi:MAG: hypothetical protein OEZ36_09765 [Spirochaetota bacterium]|nr:hypothetical protein [Spirochaetota bacterium]